MRRIVRKFFTGLPFAVIALILALPANAKAQTNTTPSPANNAMQERSDLRALELGKGIERELTGICCH
jgi:hypothetical protein